MHSLYVGPHRGMPRALEQNELKFRAVQMVLVLFHAEQLRREIIAAAESHAHLENALGFGHASDSANTPQAQVAEKKRLKRAFNALVADGVLKGEERDEIENLLGVRHDIAHEVHNLMLDVSNLRWARDAYELMAHKAYDYDAADGLERWSLELQHRIFKMQRVGTLHLERHMFQAADRTFKAELRRLKRIIGRQVRQRTAEIESLKQECDLSGTELVGQFSPSHPYAHYDGGRLTKLGVEICYRLFDRGKSTLAVAHMLRLSLTAASRRRNQWQALGASNRVRADLASIPRRRFDRRGED